MICKHIFKITFLNEPGIIFLHTVKWCPWCNGYRRRIWTWRYEFKSWTRLTAFHIAVIPLGKVWIQLFSLQLWVNSRTDWFLQPWGGFSDRKIVIVGWGWLFIFLVRVLVTCFLARLWEIKGWWRSTKTKWSYEWRKQRVLLDERGRYVRSI